MAIFIVPKAVFYTEPPINITFADTGESWRLLPGDIFFADIDTDTEPTYYSPAIAYGYGWKPSGVLIGALTYNYPLLLPIITAYPNKGLYYPFPIANFTEDSIYQGLSFLEVIMQQTGRRIAGFNGFTPLPII